MENSAQMADVPPSLKDLVRETIGAENIGRSVQPCGADGPPPNLLFGQKLVVSGGAQKVKGGRSAHGERTVGPAISSLVRDVVFSELSEF